MESVALRAGGGVDHIVTRVTVATGYNYSSGYSTWGLLNFYSVSWHIVHHPLLCLCGFCCQFVPLVLFLMSSTSSSLFVFLSPSFHLSHIFLSFPMPSWVCFHIYFVILLEFSKEGRVNVCVRQVSWERKLSFALWSSSCPLKPKKTIIY